MIANVSLDRIILYVRDVRLLADFYRNALGFSVVGEITDGWAVLCAGRCQLALHRAGEAFRKLDGGSSGTNNNAKLVLTVRADLEALRAELIANGVPLGEMKSYVGVTGPLCDGVDPEGNVFQLAQA